MSKNDNYNKLISKLDQFIRKFYLNRIIRGSLYTIGFVISLFLLINFLEYNYYFSPTGRKILFFGFLGTSLVGAYIWVFQPLLSYFRLGTVISHNQAAIIIGDHFADVQDKLLNILQLKEQSNSVQGNDLLLASIDQKAEQIKLVPFKSAIDLSKNRKYARYALPPLLLLLVLLIAAPKTIQSPTYRLFNNGEEFERPAPFSFDLVNQDLTVVQYQNFPLEIEVLGDQLPSEVFVEIESFPYRMRKIGPNRFAYQFNNVQKNLDFRIVSDPVSSRAYTLEVLRKPDILGLEVKLDYPGYTGKRDETLSNIGDFSVPNGTRISWSLEAAFTDSVWMMFTNDGKLEATQRRGRDLFSFQKQAFRSDLYKLFISNDNLPKADSITYSLAVVPDRYPTIEAEEFQDSIYSKVRFFAGQASDDYGLLNLSFNYQLTNESGQPQPLQTVKLASPNGNKIAFDHLFDLNTLNLKPGEKVTYYFEVYDNDAINGNKVARTQIMQFAMPTLEEFRAQNEEDSEEIKKSLEDALRESRKIQEDLKEARDRLLQEKDLDWQNRQELEKLMERQKQLQQQLQQTQEDFQKNQENKEEFSPSDQESKEKQDKLEELFEETINEETLELMQKIQELLDELDKNKALEMMEEMQMSDEKMELELDRLLELYKQLELEQQIQQTQEQLEELAEEQDALSEETEQTDPNAEEQQEGEQQEGEQQEGEQQEGEQQEGEQQEGEQQEGEQQEQESPQNAQEKIQQEQEQINEEFQQIMEQMEKIEEKNQEMGGQQDLQEPQEQMEQIEQNLEQIQQKLQQQQNQGASQQQKKTAQQMRKMAEQMQASMQSGQMQQMTENIAALRQLLENLVRLSFDQEKLIDEFSETSLNTPRYVELIQEQFKLKDDFSLIQDSLQALSKRAFQIQSFITEKVTDINANLNNSIEELEERRLSPAIELQQRTMTNVNDLALMLSESLNQMQQQMASMMSMQRSQQNGQQQPNQQGRQPSDRISEGQKKLNDEMRKASEQMRRQREGGEGGSAKEFAEMARRQAELRKALEEKQKQLRQSGQGDPKLQEMIERMDQVERDLVNKRLTNELLQRQQDILSRLLEFEKAERQQEFEDQRKSETAGQMPPKRPKALEEYLRKREAELQQYKTVSPSLKPYFKSLVEEYFKNLNAPNNGR